MEKNMIIPNGNSRFAQITDLINARQISFPTPVGYEHYYNDSVHSSFLALNHPILMEEAKKLLESVFRLFQDYKTETNLCLVDTEMQHHYSIMADLFGKGVYHIASVKLFTESDSEAISGIEITRNDYFEEISTQERYAATYAFNLLALILRHNTER